MSGRIGLLERLHVAIDKGLADRIDHLRDRVPVGQLAAARLAQDAYICLMSDAQVCQRDAAKAGGEHGLCCLRVADEVGLSRGRPIATQLATDGAAHDDQLLHQLRKVGPQFERSGDIGQGSDGHEADLARRRDAALDDELCCRLCVEVGKVTLRASKLRCHVTHAILAVNVHWNVLSGLALV